MEELLKELESSPVIHEDLPLQKEFILKHIGDEISEYRCLISECSQNLFPFYLTLEDMIGQMILSDRNENVGYDGADIKFYELNKLKVIYGGWGCTFIIMKKEHFIDAYEIYKNSEKKL
jgi:hypothetical protein